MKILEKYESQNINLKNKIVFPAVATNLASDDSSLNEDILNHYERIAKDGAGLIITEIAKIDNDFGRTVKNQISATSFDDIEKLKALPSLVHKYDAKILLQIQHPGIQANPEFVKTKVPLGPSSITIKGDLVSKELTDREIQVLINKFSMAAKIAEDAGFDGVELHAAHGYLLSQFLSPDTNMRTDEFGGNLFNRASIIEKIVDGIRQFCSPDFLISIRYNGDDFLEEGLSQNDGIMLARVFESYGVDFLNISCGTPRSMKSGSTIIESKSYEEKWKAYLGQEIKKQVKIPVIACSNIKTPEAANDMLTSESCDLVALGRAQIADYDFIKKCRDNETETINKCISCLQCIKSIKKGQPINCPINPHLKR